MELVEQEEEEENKARVGHAAVFAFRVFLLSMQLCTARVCTAQQRVSADLPEMDVAMQAPAMQMLVLIVAAALQHSETNEDVQAFAQKLDQMIPALYHLHFVVTKDRTELLQNLRLLCWRFDVRQKLDASSSVQLCRRHRTCGVRTCSQT